MHTSKSVRNNKTRHQKPKRNAKNPRTPSNHHKHTFKHIEKTAKKPKTTNQNQQKIHEEPPPVRYKTLRAAHGIVKDNFFHVQ